MVVFVVVGSQLQWVGFAFKMMPIGPRVCGFCLMRGNAMYAEIPGDEADNLTEDAPKIEWISAGVESFGPSRRPARLEQKTVAELKNIDPWETEPLRASKKLAFEFPAPKENSAAPSPASNSDLLEKEVPVNEQPIASDHPIDHVPSVTRVLQTQAINQLRLHSDH
uniref:Uncharacterized protein n=1 Tax=Oryza punctata TaxID=4537 RepID=A0A0E0JMB7_ORYPU